MQFLVLGTHRARLLWAGFEWFDVKRGPLTEGCPGGVAVGQQACIENECYECHGERTLIHLTSCADTGCDVDPDPGYGCLCNE